jgi:coenzyme F420-reducing hydrogenase alpha subunit
VRFAVVEAPRFFEVFLRGRDFRDVVHLASRICGICAVSHRCAALKATEAAMGIDVSDQTVRLRRLAFDGELISSHVFHIYFFAAPDFLGVDSLLGLTGAHQEILLRAMRLKNVAYEICDLVGGRQTHPVGMVTGGFTFTHSAERLLAMKKRLERSVDDIKETIRLFRTFPFPELERETEYVSLKHRDHYAFYDGDLYSSEGTCCSPAQYREIEEYSVPYATAKYARWHRPEYMTGALARVNNNHEQLSPLAREAAHDLGLVLPCHNPFKITLAQIVECAHCLEESVDLIDQIVGHGLGTLEPRVAARAGAGVGAVEAPRGTLFHEYAYDERGDCTTANHVIPTAQNLANLEADMWAYAPSLAHHSPQDMTRGLEMLVRAYDPCISCSVHVVHADPSARPAGNPETQQVR